MQLSSLSLRVFLMSGVNIWTKWQYANGAAAGIPPVGKRSVDSSDDHVCQAAPPTAKVVKAVSAEFRQLVASRLLQQ